MKRIIIFFITLAMLLSLFACGKETEPANSTNEKGNTVTDVVTTAAPEVHKKSSASTKVVSDYLVEEVENFKVDKGTSYEEVLAMLPTELSVEIPVDIATAEPSKILFEADFSSMEAFLKDWEMQGNPDSTDVHDGRYCVVAADPLSRAYVKYQDWSKYNPETNEGSGYANYAVRAVLRGTQPTMSNVMGIWFRATNIDPDGDNSFDALYFGMSNSSIKTYKFNHDWALVQEYAFEYQQNVDYTFEVLVYNNRYLAFFNGEQLFEGNTDGHDFGTVGFRTWTGLYECSEFSVRSLGPEDYEKFGEYTQTVKIPVTWECWDYDSSITGKFGFFATINSDLIPEGKQAQQKVTVSVRNPE